MSHTWTITEGWSLRLAPNLWGWTAQGLRDWLWTGIYRGRNLVYFKLGPVVLAHKRQRNG